MAPPRGKGKLIREVMVDLEEVDAIKIEIVEKLQITKPMLEQQE